MPTIAYPETWFDKEGYLASISKSPFRLMDRPFNMVDKAHIGMGLNGGVEPHIVKMKRELDVWGTLDNIWWYNRAQN